MRDEVRVDRGRGRGAELGLSVGLLAMVLALGCSLLPPVSDQPGGAEPAAASSQAVVPPAPGTVPALAPAMAQWDLDWADGAVFYEIFVRSFADSDGDGVGDFRGLTAKLDYLNDGDPATDQDLGVEGIWLMPIFTSPSYHGYDTVDYESIDPEYGTLEDFETFLAEAHRRGIRVIVDLVLNHTSSQHPWFIASASSPDSPKRDWYEWSDTDPGWTRPWGDPGEPTWHEKNGAYYYAIFWGGMPDLNFRNPEVREEAKRLALLWLDRGVDGFRLDAARHMIASGPGEGQSGSEETHEYWRELAAAVRAHQPKALLVGENWTDAATIAPYYGSTEIVERGDELPASFDFPLAGAMVEAAKNGVAAPVIQALADRDALYPDGVLDATFLTNHDMVRVATELGNDPRKLRSAAALLLTIPGTPFLYYGEELGMANGPVAEGDPAKRTPMPWNGDAGAGFTTGKAWHGLAGGWQTTNVAAETGDESSLLERYRELIRLRGQVPALEKGELTVLETGNPAVLAFTAEAAGSHVLVAHNLGAEVLTTATLALPPASVAELWAGAPGVRVEATGKGCRLVLPAGASAVWSY